MSPELWPAGQAIFEEALDKAPTAREAFVRESCHDDQSLFEEVASLLASYEGAADGFLNPVVEGATTDRLEGRQVGPYRILHRLGQSGLGAVYLAARAKGYYKIGDDQGNPSEADLGQYDQARQSYEQMLQVGSP